MATFPTLSFGQVCQYPVTKTLVIPSDVARWSNDTERRYATGGSYYEWELSYDKLSSADMNALATFFNARKGGLDTTWDFPFDGTTYHNCYFLQDSFQVTNRTSIYWTCTLKLRSRTLVSPGTQASAWPSLSNGAVSTRPYGESWEWRNVVVDLPGGKRHDASYRSSVLRTFKVGAMLRADALAIEQHFINCLGRVGKFSFVDDAGSTHPKVRFGEQQLVLRYQGPQQVSVECTLEEFA